MDKKPTKTNQEETDRPKEQIGSLLFLITTLGFAVTFGIVSCFIGGVLLDKKLGTSYIKIIGLFVGLAMSFFWAYLQMSKHFQSMLSKEEENKNLDSNDNQQVRRK